MTVATETAHAERAWTGVETTFAPGIEALDAAHVVVTYRNAAGEVSTLTRGVHLSVTRDAGSGVISAVPLAMPPAPGTVIFDRVTPAVQGTNFANLGSYDPAVHTRLHDASALRDAELRRKVAELRDRVDYPRYDLAIDAVGRPGAAEVICRHIFAAEVAWPADLSGSYARAVTPAAAAAVFSLRRNGAQFATLTFAAASAAGVFAGSAALFEPGDEFTIVAPSPRDEALSDLAITIAGSRQ